MIDDGEGKSKDVFLLLPLPVKRDEADVSWPRSGLMDWGRMNTYMTMTNEREAYLGGTMQIGGFRQ